MGVHRLSAVIIKTLLLVIAGKSFAVAFLPPNPPTGKKLFVNFFENYTAYFVVIMTSTFWVVVGVDALATFLNSGIFNSSVTDRLADRYLCPNNAGARNLSPSLPLFFHTGLLALSAIGRVWCFRTLGKQFRFEVSLQENHRLVTSGPYAFVRHPGYLVLYGSYVGTLGMMVAKGGWIRECFLQVPGATVVSVIGGQDVFGALLELSLAEYTMISFVGTWLVALVYCERSLAAKCAIEDEVLKKKFGKEWIEYSRRVPWRILPYVY